MGKAYYLLYVPIMERLSSLTATQFSALSECLLAFGPCGFLMLMPYPTLPLRQSILPPGDFSGNCCKLLFQDEIRDTNLDLRNNVLRGFEALGHTREAELPKDLW